MCVCTHVHALCVYTYTHAYERVNVYMYVEARLTSDVLPVTFHLTGPVCVSHLNPEPADLAPLVSLPSLGIAYDCPENKVAGRLLH